METTDSLDADIATLRDRISSLKSHRATLASTLLSTPSLSTTLKPRPDTPLATQISRQRKHNLISTYRACAGITAYKVKDPDPNAVDDGNVLGVRIEICIGGVFVETSHVLFNRPSGGEKGKRKLKIVHHTIPACVPVRQLAERWVGKGDQDVVRFGRVLRRELVGWHLRCKAVEKLRAEAGVKDRKEPEYGTVLNAFVSDDEDEEDEDEDEESSRRRSKEPGRIIDLQADLGVREIVITWSNGQSGTVTVAKDGEVRGGVFRTAKGVRLVELERKVVGRIEGMVQRLTA